MTEASSGNDAKLTVTETLVPQGRPRAPCASTSISIVYAQAGSNLEERFERVRRVTDEVGRVAAVRPPARRARRRARRAGARGAAAEADVRDRRRLSRASARRQLLGARDLALVPAAAARRAGLHVPRRVRVKKPFVPFAPGKTVRRARRATTTSSRPASTSRCSSPSSSRAGTTWKRRCATA